MKKLNAEQWKKVCVKAICEGSEPKLRAALDYLDEQDSHMVSHYKRELLNGAMEQRKLSLVDLMLDHKEFWGMETMVMAEAVTEDDRELLEVALNYANPNGYLSYFGHQKLEGKWESTFPGRKVDGMSYYIHGEPLALCAFRGNVDLAKLLMERGAREDGMALEDLLNRRNPEGIGTECNSRLGCSLRWDKNNHHYLMKCHDSLNLPPWAYAMHCEDPEKASWFLSLGKDGYSLELALAVSMVRSGAIMDLLLEKKPQLMSRVEPEFILRYYWPEAVERYFDSGKEIPKNAVQMMGSYVFEEYDFVMEMEKPIQPGIREDDFIKTLKILMKRGYRLDQEDLEYLTKVMVAFRSEKLLKILKGRVPQDLDFSGWIDLLPVKEQDWEFGQQLVKEGIRFQVVIQENSPPCFVKNYHQTTRLLKLAEIQSSQPNSLDSFTRSVLLSRSKKAVALLWKKGLLNPMNLSEATRLICEVQITELYDLMTELAGVTGGSEKRYEL